MYVVSYIKQGFGNKIFLLQNIIYFYLELKKINHKFDKLYVSILKSKHEKDSQLSAVKEFLNIFPYLDKDINIKFIGFKDLDILKRECVVIKQNELTQSSFKTLTQVEDNIYFDTEYNFSLVPVNSYYTLFKKLFEINMNLTDNLLYNYNFKNDIMMHIRYGDKFNLKDKNKNVHIVLKPKYYFDALYDLLLKLKEVKKQRVFIFTDDIKEIKNMFMEEFSKIKNVEFIISDEPYWNVYYLCTKFENMILSSSTLTYAGVVFNEDYKNVITFKYGGIKPKDKYNTFWTNKKFRTVLYKKNLYFIEELNKKDFIIYDDFNYLF